MSVPLKSVFSSTSSDINCHIQAKAFCRTREGQNKERQPH